MSRLWVLFLCLSCATLVGCRRASPPAKTWYDVAPLLQSVRAAEVAVAKQRVGRALDTLPHYALTVRLGESFESFDLAQRVYFENQLGRALDELVLRVYVNATADKPLVTLRTGSCADAVVCTVTQPEPSVIVVALGQPLPVGGRVVVDLSLDGRLSQIAKSRTSMLAQGLESLGRLKSGQGGGDYGLLAHGDGIASFASFYPVLARFGGGTWERSEASTLGDLSAERLSHVSLELSVAGAASVATSGLIVATGSAESPGALRLTVQAGLVRDFSFLVSPRFEQEERKVGDVTVRSHFLSADRAGGEKVLDAAAGALAVFEKRFGRYPYRDLDVVEAPLVGGAGGVEFSGLVTVASMLYRPRLGDGVLGTLLGALGGPAETELTSMTHDMLEFVTAHEVAHQWFPGLVGSDVRRHPYVDESLAQWSGLLYLEDRYGPERAAREAGKQVTSNYHLMRLLGTPDGAVDRPVAEFGSEIAYAGIVYGKGPLFYRELRALVGDEAFFAALRQLVDRHRFADAPPRALVDELARGQKRAEVRALARRWLDESHGDADLGTPDLRALIGAWVGPEAAAQMGPELELAMKLLLRLGAGGDSGGTSLGDLLDTVLGGGR